MASKEQRRVRSQEGIRWSDAQPALELMSRYIESLVTSHLSSSFCSSLVTCHSSLLLEYLEPFLIHHRIALDDNVLVGE